jgi:hypothetical protein
VFAGTTAVMFVARDFESETDLRRMQEVVLASWRVEKPLVRDGLAAGRLPEPVGRGFGCRMPAISTSSPSTGGS